MMYLQTPCPPHEWSHASTVGYFRCGRCGEQINFDDPRYAELLAQGRASAGDDEAEAA
jgi:hypothetical protein